MLYKLTLTLALLISAVCLGCSGDAAAPAPPPTTIPTAPPTQQPAQSAAPSGGNGDVVKVENQDIGGSGEYIFVPSEFHFEVGQTVTFEMSAETEFHTFTVDELDIDVEIDAGDTVTYTHTFDKAGEFELICIPHLAFGMTGTIVVE